MADDKVIEKAGDGMLEHWLWLAGRTGMTDRIKYELLQRFGSPEAVFSASEQAGEGLRDEARESLRDKSLIAAEKILEACNRSGVRILTFPETDYPNRLQNIYDPPLVLYCKGTLPSFDDLPVIGIVGTRKASAYGLGVAHRLGAEVAGCGGLVVSGLADGIDGAAMQGALTAHSGPVGVLGCGIDVVYPRSNRGLFADTERYGCLLSEFCPGTEPLKWNFPRRNRIISGLSCGVVVVEAPAKSGALITAKCALEQGRDVFAVPGNVDNPEAAGSNALLRDGAGTVTCGWEVMSEYQARFPDKIHKVSHPIPPRPEPVTAAAKVAQTPRKPGKKPEPEVPSGKKDIDNSGAAPYIDLKQTSQAASWRLNEQEQAIVGCLQENQTRLVDEVIAESGLPSGAVLRTLTMLEIRKIIVRHPGNRISLRD